MTDAKTIFYLVASISVSTAIFVFIVIFSDRIGFPTAAVASTFSAAAIAGSAVVTLFAFQHSRKTTEKTTEESWLVTYRELHKEFWGNPAMAKVRSWLCCDEAYHNELKPILIMRIGGQVTQTEYESLESLDQFCALMLRIVHMEDFAVSKQQKQAYEKLGYYQWAFITKHRDEVTKYIEIHWEPLFPHIRDAKLNRSQ